MEETNGSSNKSTGVYGDELLLKFHEMGLKEERVLRHERVFTCEAATKVVKGCPGENTKSLFLTDKKHKVYILVICREDIKFTFDEFSKKLKLPRLSLARPERMYSMLGVSPGSCSPFTVINDKENKVIVYLDKYLTGEQLSKHHPNDNSMTVILAGSEIVSFLSKCGHEPVIFDYEELFQEDGEGEK